MHKNPYWMKFMVMEGANWYQLAINTLKTTGQGKRQRFLEELLNIYPA